MLRNLLLLTITFALVGLLCEAVLRVAGLAPTEGIYTVDQREFEQIPGLFSPNQRAEDTRIRALPFVATIDSLGYRSPDFPRTKGAGEIRVFFAGDSGVFGDFVADSETLPMQLENHLRNRCESVVVINGGVGGTTIVGQSEMVERALVLEPDVVLLQFSENDVTDLVSPLWYELASNRAAKSRFPLSVTYPILRETALWNLLLEARGKWRNRTIQGRVGSAATPISDEQMQGLRDRYEARLVELSGMLESRAVPLIAVFYPSHQTLYDVWDGAQMNWFLSMTDRLGIPTVNLEPRLRASGLGDTILYLLPHDGHASPRGYGIAAGVIADTLPGLIPPLSRCS